MIELKLKFNVPELTASRMYWQYRDIICGMISDKLSLHSHLNVPKIATIYTEHGIENVLINGMYFEYSPTNYIDISDISTYTHEVYFAECITIPVDVQDIVGSYVPHLYEQTKLLNIPLMINYHKDNSNNYLITVELSAPYFQDM